jgi:hypothetical protein
MEITNYGVQFLDVREPVETREWQTQTWGYSSLDDAISDAQANADMCRRKDSPVFIFRVVEINGEYSEGYFEAVKLFI